MTGIRDWSNLLDRSDVLIVGAEATGLGRQAEAEDAAGMVALQELVMPEGPIHRPAQDFHLIGLQNSDRRSTASLPPVSDDCRCRALCRGWSAILTRLAPVFPALPD